MLSAIKEIADSRPDERQEHMATYAYLKACNLIFEEGILSEKCITYLYLDPYWRTWKMGLRIFQIGERKYHLQKEVCMLMLPTWWFINSDC